jgi:tripartite-type tricarboxylate transporter receptor subunit TctC
VQDKQSGTTRHTSIDRRRFLKAVGATGVATGLAGCGATSGLGGGGSEFPNEDMTFIVPSPPGGGFSNIGEVLIPYMEEELPGDANISLDHTVGGGGLAATEKAWGAQADGHQILFMYTNQTVIGDLFLDSAFNPREFGYIGVISEDPYSLLGRTDTEIQGWDDFVSRVGEFNFATQGVGTNGHIDILVIGELTGAFGVDDLNFTHYEGSGPAAQAMASGEAQFLGQTAPGTFNDAQSFESLEMVFTFAPRDGTGGKFAPQSRFFLEDIPADGIEEAVQPTNFPRFFAVPPGVEESRLETLRSAFSAVLENDEFRSEIENVHMLTSPTTGQERVMELIDSQYDTYQSEPFNSLLGEALS